MTSYVSQTAHEILLKPNTEANNEVIVSQTSSELLLKPGTEANTESIVTQVVSEVLLKPEAFSDCFVGQFATEVLSKPDPTQTNVYVSQFGVELLVKMPKKYSTQGDFFLMFSPNVGFFQNIHPK